MNSYHLIGTYRPAVAESIWMLRARRSERGSVASMRPALLLLVLVALAGCGGDDGPSADGYRQQAEEICATAILDAAAVTSPVDSAESVAAYSEAVGEIRTREAVALSELEPPSELKKSHELLVNASGAIVRSLTDLARAAEREDQTAAQAAAETGARAAVQARRAAGELGLPACGKPGRAQ